MQKLITSFTLLLLVNTGLKAQSQFVQAKKEISITTVNGSGVTTGKNSPLLVSDFIAVQTGDKITMHPYLLVAPKQHNFLKGALKSTGAFLLTQQVNKTLSYSSSKAGSNTTTAKTNAIPAIGIGLAAGLPNIVKGLKTKKTYIVYSTYDGDKNLLSAQKIKITKQNNSLTFNNVNADGFVKVVLLGNKKNILKGDITITVEGAKINGGIAENFNLNSFGDCNGGGGESSCVCINLCNNTAQSYINAASATLTAAILACLATTGPFSPLCIASVTLVYITTVDAIEADQAKCIFDCQKAYPIECK